MIFQHTLSNVLNFKKTQTRRVVKDSEQAIRGRYNQILSVSHNNRVKWRVGNTYSIQPGRGKSQVARFEITKIRSEKLHRVSTNDAICEGFANRRDFLHTWKEIHGEDSLDMRVWVIEFKVIAVLIDTENIRNQKVAELYAN